jgi:hypothetical protein
MNVHTIFSLPCVFVVIIIEIITYAELQLTAAANLIYSLRSVRFPIGYLWIRSDYEVIDAANFTSLRNYFCSLDVFRRLFCCPYMAIAVFRVQKGLMQIAAK